MAGLGEQPYLDNLDARSRQQQPPGNLAFDREVDRIFVGAPSDIKVGSGCFFRGLPQWAEHRSCRVLQGVGITVAQLQKRRSGADNEGPGPCRAVAFQAQLVARQGRSSVITMQPFLAMIVSCCPKP